CRRLAGSSLVSSGSFPNSGPPAPLQGPGTRTAVGRRGPAHPIRRHGTGRTVQSWPTDIWPCLAASSLLDSLVLFLLPVPLAPDHGLGRILRVSRVGLRQPT